jgi:predicted SAM-dependent methyltransferase
MLKAVSLGKNNVPSEIIASNNVMKKNKTPKLRLTCRARESTRFAQRSVSQMTGEYHDFE